MYKSDGRARSGSQDMGQDASSPDSCIREGGGSPLGVSLLLLVIEDMFGPHY